MQKLKLTEKRIRELEPPANKAYERYWDTEVKGLCVKVLRSGRKVYYFKDRFNGEVIYGKNLPACSELSLSEMRDEALQWKAQIRKGANPWKVKAKVHTVTELCEENIEAKRKLGRSELHLRDMEKATDEIRKSKLGKMGEDEVTMREASDFLGQYHGRDRWHDELRWFLFNSFELAIKKGRLPLNSNPWHYIDKRYTLPDRNELPRFTDSEISVIAGYLRRAENGDLDPPVSPAWVRFIWFLIRTGMRPGDALMIRTSWIKQTSSGVRYVDHPRTKTGGKRIVLPSEVDVPDDLGVYLFPGRRRRNSSGELEEGPLMNYRTEFGRMRRETRLDKPAYAIRRWFASVGRRTFDGDIGPIQQLVGWETEEMALRYAGDDEELLEKVIAENAEVCRQVASRVDEVLKSQPPNSHQQTHKSTVNGDHLGA